MNSTMLKTSVVFLALAASTQVSARDAAHDRMAAVQNNAAPGQPGNGWAYFSDVAAVRAVVISPSGSYYFSNGKVLKQVTGRAAKSAS